jgi:hypothetical protein
MCGRSRLILLALVVSLTPTALAGPAVAGHGNADVASPNMFHLGNSKPATARVNSDLAFWANLVFAGNYNGFRIIDASNPKKPEELVDYPCRGPQNDVSVWGTNRRNAQQRLLLFLSVDTRQREERCSGDDPTRSTGWEGIRIFDVTNPRDPQFVRGVATDCGSHTHTLIPVRKTGDDYAVDTKHPNHVLLYVSSYPLTGQGVHGDLGQEPEDPFEGDVVKCLNDHNQISIVDVPLDSPQDATVRRYPLDADTRGVGVVAVRGCHDIQVFLDLKLAAAACLGEGQIWDISDPANPQTTGPGHTHVRNEDPVGPASPNETEIWHSAQFTWDGKYVVFDDEQGGAETPGCGSNAQRDGNGWIYRVKRPPQQLEGPLGRFMIPRNQLLDGPVPAQECTIHNGNFITTNKRYLHASAWYKGGSDVIDWTDPLAPAEFAFFDEHNADGRGHDDVWSSYWYDGLIYSNGGLDRSAYETNRGLDIYRLTHSVADSAKHFGHMNPQTQEQLIEHGAASAGDG